MLPDGIVEQGLIQDTTALGETITYALENCVPTPPKSREAVVSLPERHTFLQVLTVPAMTDAETDEAISWAVRPHLPYDFEQMYLSWQPVGAAGKSPARERSVLIGATLKSAIDPLIKTFQDLPLTLVAIEASSQALLRSVLPPSLEDSRSIAILDMGATSTNIVFVRAGSIQMSTSLDRGGQDITQAVMKKANLSREAAERKKVQIGLASSRSGEEKISAIIREEAGNLLQDVRQTIQARVSSNLYLESPQLFILAGGTTNLPNFDTALRENFPGVPFQFAQPWTTINVSSRVAALKLSDEDARHFVISSGLAQRPMNRTYASPTHAINLLPPRQRSRVLTQAAVASAEKLTSVSLAASFILTIFGIVLLLALTLITRLAPAPDPKALAAAASHNQEIANAYKARNDFLNRLAALSRETTLWTERIPTILGALPPGLQLRNIRGRSLDHTLVVSGIAASRSAIQAAEQELSRLPAISRVVSPPTNFLRQSDAEFRLELTLRPPSP